MLGVELDRKLVGVISFANEDVLVTTLSDLNSQRQDFVALLWRSWHLLASRFWGAS